MKAYGIRDTKNDEWLRSHNVLVVFYSVGAAEAQRTIVDNECGNGIYLEVAEIGEDGLPVEAEHGPETSNRFLLKVAPQPHFIESSGRWVWPLPVRARSPGCSDTVHTASREWWEYAPSEAKPHPTAEGVMLRDGVWYWAVPAGGAKGET